MAGLAGYPPANSRAIPFDWIIVPPNIAPARHLFDLPSTAEASLAKAGNRLPHVGTMNLHHFSRNARMNWSRSGFIR